jgi:hypothetical protein
VTGLSSTSAGGPGAASTAPDGLELAIDGFYDKVVQSALVPDGGEPMGIYKKLERFLTPAINQPKAWKIKLFLSMLSSSSKQHLYHPVQENFNVG